MSKLHLALFKKDLRKNMSLFSACVAMMIGRHLRTRQSDQASYGIDDVGIGSCFVQLPYFVLRALLRSSQSHFAVFFIWIVRRELPQGNFQLQSP